MSSLGFATTLPNVPATASRPPAVPALPHAGVPRADVAADDEHPDGTTEGFAKEARGRMTVLQQHVSFWDRRRTGRITPLDTYSGFRALGFMPPIAAVGALAFNVLHVGPWTSRSWMPDPTFGVDVGRVHRAKHGSGTGAYDAAGRFVPQKFEDIFSQYGTQDAKGRRGIDGRGIMAMVAGNRNVLDPVGWIFQVFLWGFLWLLAADRSGFVSKEDVRRQYDGTLYREIEARRKKGEKLPWWRGGTGF